MEAKSKINEWMDSASDWLNEQTWFQQLKAKWEELDAQSRVYVQFGAAGGAVLITLFALLSFYWSVRSTRQELMAKTEILNNLSASTDELRALQATNANSSAATASTDPWATYFESTAGTNGIPKSSISVSDPKTGPASDVSKETMFDLSLKKVSIRQAVRFAQALENGARPVKLKNLTIDTQPDMSGYLDVTLSVSGFALVTK